VLGALSSIPPTLLLLNQQRQSCRTTVEYTPLLGATETGSNTDTDDTPPQNQPTLNPFIVYFLEALFFFLMGQEIAFSSWISSYVVESGISKSDANAAYMSSAFYAAMLTGRLLMGWSASLVQVKNSTLLKSSINFQFLSSTFLLVFCFTWRSYKQYAYLVLTILVVVRSYYFCPYVIISFSYSMLTIDLWLFSELLNWFGNKFQWRPSLFAMVRSS
jgi:hypothetical protein